MPKEAQPLSFEEVKEGSPEKYVSFRKLTPEGLLFIQKHLNERVDVTFTIETRIYEGSEDSQMDLFAHEIQVSGILARVDERTIGVQVQSGKTTYDYGHVVERGKSYSEFPFYQGKFTYMSDQEDSYIKILSVAGQTFQLDRSTITAVGAKTEDSRIGECPKCDGATEIKLKTSFPFPEDEQSRIQETCKCCDFTIERDFWSTDTTSNVNQEYSNKRDEKNVLNAIREISNIISTYDRCHIRPNITTITTILASLHKSEFPLLYVHLKELKKTPLAGIRFDPLGEIMSAARADSQFGQMSGGMAEFYDNEARAVSNDQGIQKSVLDSIKELVIIVEEGIK